MNILQERYSLAIERVKNLDVQELPKTYEPYVDHCRKFFLELDQVYTKEHTREKLLAWNQIFYQDLQGDNYETSYGNPAYMRQTYGEKIGDYLCLYYVSFRDGIVAAYEKDLETLTLCLELFLQMLLILQEDEVGRCLKETIYYHIHDYDETRVERSVERMLLPKASSFICKQIMESDFTNPDYLYEFGEYITENEIQIARFLNSYSEEELAKMAQTYTEGYRKGFEIAGIDLSKKKTVQIRYHIGFEPMVKQAILQFRAMGLEPVFSRTTNRAAIGVYSSSPNRQYQYDHRFDNALYMNKALLANRLKYFELSFQKYEKEALEYAGPAVIEIFGEKLFQPEAKEEAPAYRGDQEKMFVEYRRDYSLLQNRFIPSDSYSFTIIAYPIPEIGDQFEEIFAETVKVNTLDMDLYRRIHQKLIDALDQGEEVHITGRGDNRTDMYVHLHHLENPQGETNFENCLADVNIPVGEVFTSPVLKGTKGCLHVTQVYLNGLRYENLEIKFEDGMIADYTCSNYDKEEDNKKFIKENILHNRETLPIGEFAIGTNTTAYQMGRKFDIEAKLPILIAEKTGPHFAVGDTCYSMSEDQVLHNPDGKEIIAKENEVSALRKTQPDQAYFNCHTDITIPYDELGDIEVFTLEGKTIKLLEKGRFVLEGTEVLNEILDRDI
ncbi:MAG: aminopeptidase [Eubacterium sp.]|nr:aminopeptidase [Eubacterium sp.]